MQLYKYLPLPSDRMGTLWALTAIEDAYIIEYGPAGTTHYGIEGFMRLNADMRGKLYTTHMDEGDIVMGDSIRLEETIKEVDSIYKPRYIFVIASSISSIIGTDLENICDNLKEAVNAKLIPFTGGGFRGDYTLGIREVLTAIALNIVKESNGEKMKTFNIIGSVVDSYNYLSDIKEVENIMKKAFQYDINAVFTANSSIDELEKAASASINIVLRSEGIECAEILKNKHGIPYVVGAPYGLKGTLGWIKKIEEVLSIPANTKYIAEETGKCKKNIMRFKHTSMMYKKMKTILAGNYDFVLDAYSFLKDDLSLDIEKAIINHNIKGGKFREVQEDIEKFMAVNPSEEERETFIAEIKPDVLFGDALTIQMAEDTPIKLQVSNPNLHKINIYEYTPFMGFNGASYIIQLFLNEISNNSSKLRPRF